MAGGSALRAKTARYGASQLPFRLPELNLPAVTDYPYLSVGRGHLRLRRACSGDHESYCALRISGHVTARIRPHSLANRPPLARSADSRDHTGRPAAQPSPTSLPQRVADIAAPAEPCVAGISEDQAGYDRPAWAIMLRAGDPSGPPMRPIGSGPPTTLAQPKYRRKTSEPPSRDARQ